MNPSGPAYGAPVIPPPPPRVGRRGKRSEPNHRMWLWPLAMVLGVGLGVVAYRFVPRLDFYFEYWVALAVG